MSDNSKIYWDMAEDGTIIATISFGENGYASYFIEPCRGEFRVESQVFNSQGDGFDGRYLYFESIEQAKWYIELMADTIATVKADKPTEE